MLGTYFVLRRINKLEKQMTKEMQDLQDGLGAIKQAVLDAVSNIKWLSDRIANAQAAVLAVPGVDPAVAADVEQVAVELRAFAAQLESAVVPGQPAPVAVPPAV